MCLQRRRKEKQKVTAYGHRFVRLDNYNKLDLIVVAMCIFQFVVQLAMYLTNLEAAYQTVLAVTFIFVMAVRLVHAVKYFENWLLNMLHKYLDKTIYAAYETGLAIITGEEEVQQNVWKYVRSAQLALDTRSRATNNRLLVLRKLVEIQSRFPGIAVAFKSRQAGQTILNDVSVHLSDIQRDGFFSEEQHRDLYKMLKDHMMGIICAPNSLPASYKPIAVLRVIPWIATDSVRQFIAMQLRPVAFAAQEVIVERGCETPIIVTYSGIIKIEGDVEYRGDGSLPNSSSTLFFFSDEYFEDYMGAPVTLGALGLISDEPSVTRVTTETAVNVSARHSSLRYLGQHDARIALSPTVGQRGTLIGHEYYASVRLGIVSNQRGHELQPSGDVVLVSNLCPMVASGSAADWRRRQQSFLNFDDFAERFRSEFLPPDYAERIRDELRARTQHKDESLVEFVRALQTLYDRAEPSASPAERVARAIRQSHPQFHPYCEVAAFQT
ncbi:hypothetical protein HPB47_003934 [Ixodes persulcatus]|uniref:Uncharacterized protein n=1 Tax=Ixodes persulcatus TaxID=34615 RepID=A0AC60PH10_IXOPE|nr:hypothetical protein HPB47_003934 [Ixodes persulcatus]